MEQQQTSPVAGWYPDAQVGEGGLRWWDGAQWTTHVHLPAPAPVAATTPSPDAQPQAAPVSQAPTAGLHEQGYTAVVEQHVARARAAMESDPGNAAKVRRARIIGVGVVAFLGLLVGGFAGLPLFLLPLMGAVGGWFLGPAARRWIVESGAESEAHEAFMSSWAAARGWTYQAESPQWDDVPFLRQGDDRTSAECLSGQLWSGVPGHIYNFTYEVESTDSEGNTTTTTYEFTVLRAEVPLGLPQLQVRPRALKASRMFDRLKGTVTSRRPVRLESREFEEQFVLEVDDAADELAVRTLFDPVLITHCIDSGRSFPGLEANSRAIVFVREDHYDASDADELAEVDAFIAAVRPTVDRMMFNMRHFGAAGAA